MKDSLILNVLAYPAEDKDGFFIAHCLEFDLCAEGHTVDAAILALKKLVTAYIVNSMKNSGRIVIKPAPDRYYEMLESSEKVEMPDSNRVPEVVKRIEYRRVPA